jgi:hypothetical protein
LKREINMSSLSTLNRMNVGDDEDEDAALVDSFFLPGGILDPDVEEENELPSRIASPFKTEPRRVPSNPWSNPSFQQDEDEDHGGPRVENFMTVEQGPQHLAPSNLFGDHSSETPAPPAVRPPPGYAEGNRYDSNYISSNTNSTINSREEEMGEPLGLRNTSQKLSYLPTLDLGTAPLAGPASPLHGRTIQRPRPPAPDAGPHRGSDSKTSEAKLMPSPTFKTGKQLEHRESPGGLDRLIMEVTSLDSLPSPDVPEAARLHDASHRVARAKVHLNNDEKSSISDSSGANDHENEEEEDNSVRTNSSAPLEFLSISGIYKGDSLTSSLSTSTLNSDGEDALSVIDINGEQLADDLEDIADHVTCDSRVVGVVEDESNPDDEDDESTDEDMPPVDSNGKEIPRPYSPQSERASFSDQMQERWRALSSIFFSVELPDIVTRAFRTPDMQTVEQTRVYQSLSKISTSIFSHSAQMMATLRVVFQWMVDIKDVLTIWISQFLSSLRVVLVTITKALILFASFLLQVWKSSLIEAVEEVSVTICYMVFYFMPRFCSLIMQHVNLPHWTPHLLTTVAVFSLCNQIKPGPLQEESASIFQRAEQSTDDQAKDSSQSLTSQDPAETETPRDERACKTILQILRYVLPAFFLADGLSSKFGTIMGVSGASRLTTAFMMSLVRKNIVSSPIGWISWAVQVLVATYYSSSSLLDQVVFVVGLSSIRLIRYLEVQRANVKSQSGKSS